MENDLNFEVFLFFSPEKIILSVNRKTDFKIIFKDEFFFENSSTQLNFNKLDFFLNENIFKIEKILGNFVEKMNDLKLDKPKKIDIAVPKNNKCGS